MPHDPHIEDIDGVSCWTVTLSEDLTGEDANDPEIASAMALRAKGMLAKAITGHSNAQLSWNGFHLVHRQIMNGALLATYAVPRDGVNVQPRTPAP